VLPSFVGDRCFRLSLISYTTII